MIKLIIWLIDKNTFVEDKESLLVKLYQTRIKTTKYKYIDSSTAA